MHTHGHDHPHAHPKKNLILAVIFTGLFCIVEALGGYLSHSLALLSDAGHMFIDLGALIFVLIGTTISQRPPSERKTFGYYRFEILTAFINGGLLIFIAFEILRSAFVRFGSLPTIDTGLMLTIAVAGLFINLLCMYLLRTHHHHLGTRSAYYHLLSDFISSLATILAALMIKYTGLLWIDLATSIFIAGAILYNARGLITESMDILLEAVPSSTPLHEVQKALDNIEGVQGVHDLHIWTIGSGFLSATAHLLVFPMDVRESEHIVKKAAHVLKHQFKITHSTFQIESIPAPRQITVEK